MKKAWVIGLLLVSSSVFADVLGQSAGSAVKGAEVISLVREAAAGTVNEAALIKSLGATAGKNLWAAISVLKATGKLGNNGTDFAGLAKVVEAEAMSGDTVIAELLKEANGGESKLTTALTVSSHGVKTDYTASAETTDMDPMGALKSFNPEDTKLAKFKNELVADAEDGSLVATRRAETIGRVLAAGLKAAQTCSPSTKMGCTRIAPALAIKWGMAGLDRGGLLAEDFMVNKLYPGFPGENEEKHDNIVFYGGADRALDMEISGVGMPTTVQSCFLKGQPG